MTALHVSELMTQALLNRAAAHIIVQQQQQQYYRHRDGPTRGGGYLQKPCLDPVTTSYDDSLVNYEDNNYTAGTADIKNGLYIYISVLTGN